MDNDNFYTLKQRIISGLKNNGKVLRLFENGNQGICGTFSVDGEKVVFKLSQYIDYIAEHEYEIMKGLDTISTFCPHFCRSIALFDRHIEPKPKNGANPFIIVSKYPIKKSILVEEYIRGHNISYYFKKNQNAVFSSIKQILSAITIAQKSIGFAHYDLHSDNILLEKCPPDQVNLYIFDKEFATVVPTHGFIPKVIDFGFSYNENMNDKYATTGISYTEIGYMSDRLDWIADFKLFLVSISKEMKKINSKDPRINTLRNIARNIFGKLDINWEKGWDNDNSGKAVSTATIDVINKMAKPSGIFKDHCYSCIDIIQSMIILPFTKKSSDELHVAYSTFLKEFNKIEKEFGSSIYKVYILKCIVDIAKKIKIDYMDDEKRPKAVEIFKNTLKGAITSIAKFCLPKGIRYELMLCSLYSVADGVEGIMYKNIEKRVAKKNKMYQNVIPKSAVEISKIVDANIEDPYVYTPNTVIVVYDGHEKCRREIKISAKQVDIINKMPHFIKAKFLMDMYRGGESISDESSWSNSDLSESDILGE